MSAYQPPCKDPQDDSGDVEGEDMAGRLDSLRMVHDHEEGRHGFDVIDDVRRC